MLIQLHRWNRFFLFEQVCFAYLRLESFLSVLHFRVLIERELSIVEPAEGLWLDETIASLIFDFDTVIYFCYFERVVLESILLVLNKGAANGLDLDLDLFLWIFFLFILFGCCAAQS